MKDFIYYAFNINLKNIKESQIASWIFQERFNNNTPEVINMISQPILIDDININDIPEFEKIENIDRYHVIQVDFQNKPAAVIFKKLKKYDIIHPRSVINMTKYLKPLLKANTLEDFDVYTLKIFDTEEEAKQYRDKIWNDYDQQARIQII